MIAEAEYPRGPVDLSATWINFAFSGVTCADGGEGGGTIHTPGYRVTSEFSQPMQRRAWMGKIAPREVIAKAFACSIVPSRSTPERSIRLIEYWNRFTVT